MSRASLPRILLCILPLIAAGSASAQLPAKLAGVARIGVVLPHVDSSSQNASSVADSVRAMFAEYLQGPTIEVALLGARLASQYRIEAAQAECDAVLVITLQHESGRMNEAFGRALGNLAQRAPIANGELEGAVLREVAYSVADFAGSIQARDQIRLDYRLDDITGAPIREGTAKRRAKSDGEDLLSPLVLNAAEAIGAAIAARSSP